LYARAECADLEEAEEDRPPRGHGVCQGFGVVRKAESVVLRRCATLDVAHVLPSQLYRGTGRRTRAPARCSSNTDPSACIDEAVGNYLVNLTTPPEGTICEPDRHPFDPDFRKSLP